MSDQDQRQEEQRHEEQRHSGRRQGFLISDRRKGWFEPKITTGSIIQVVLIISGIFFAWAQIDKNYELLKQRLDLYIEQNEKEKALRDSLDKVQDQLRQLDQKIDARSAENRRIGG